MLPLLQGHKYPMERHLGKFDIHKSTCSDEILPQMLRKLANTIVRLFTIIFERSRQSGEVPENWKKANVIPDFKKRQELGVRELQASLSHLNA